MKFFILLFVLIALSNNVYSDEEGNFDENSIYFEDETLAWGLLAEHRQTAKKLTGMNEILGGGICVLDYDNDGWQDVFIIGGSGHHRFYGRSAWWTKSTGNTLWRNTGNNRFENVTQASLIPVTAWGMGCAVGDLDNDGDSELLILNMGKNTLLDNNSDGTFTDITNESGLFNDEKWSLSASMADYDGDGLLDIYIVNFIDYEKAARVFERSSGFMDPVAAAFDPILYDSQANNLYHNEGRLKFLDKAAELDILDATGRGKAARWLDANNDNRPDLMILNSAGTPNQLYINSAEKGFYTDPGKYRIESAVGSHSGVNGDIDNDGDNDLILSRSAGFPPMLLINNGSPLKVQSKQSLITGGYTDLTWELGLANDTSLYYEGWDMVLEDFNNNGWLDLYMANGATTIDPDSLHVTIGQPDALWLNKGGMFQAIPLNDPSKRASRSAVSGDFNRDGLQDIIVSHNNGFPRLLINKSKQLLKQTSNWISIRLNNDQRTAIGSTITLFIGEQVRTRQYLSDNGYLSQGAEAVHFGLGTITPDKNNKITLIEVIWPDGEKSKYRNIKVNQNITITRSKTYIQPNISKVGNDSKKSASRYFETLNFTEKILFLKLISQIESLEYNHIFIQAFNEENKQVQLTVLDAAYQSKADNLFYILSKALKDKNQAVQSRSIDILSELELERSVSWLLPLFSDKSSVIKCQVAKTFQNFFYEEEAVIERKYIALPELIRLLEDNDPVVKICAIKALAEAEKYRAVQPLISLLSDENIEVRSEAALGLGALRDIKAINKLVEIIKSEREDVKVRRNALISMKKLDRNHIDDLLQILIEQSNNKASIKELINIINELIVHKEGQVVFNKSKLENYKIQLQQIMCHGYGSSDYCVSNIAYGGGNYELQHHSAVDKVKLVKTNKTLKNKQTDLQAVKKQIKDANNTSLSIGQRFQSMEYIAQIQLPYARQLVLDIAKNKNDELSTQALALLENFVSNNGVRHYLWQEIKLINNTEIRKLTAANILTNKHQGKENQYKVINEIIGNRY